MSYRKTVTFTIVSANKIIFAGKTRTIRHRVPSAPGIFEFYRTADASFKHDFIYRFSL